MDELRSSGRVTAVGLGVNEVDVVQEAMQEFDLDVTMLAGRYTLLEQASLPFLQECLHAGNAIVIAGPFNSGILVGNNKFNYDEAPREVVDHVRSLQAVCDEFGVPLPAAALHFPLAHPAVVSCVAGARNARQLETNVAWFESDIPSEFWVALRERGLIAEEASLPKSRG